MLGVRFNAGRVEEQVLLCKMVRKAVDGDDLRFPIGERPRFVKRDLGDGRKPLQSVALAHEKAVFGGIPNRGHDGGGGGQDQGAGTKDHQNGHRPDDLPGDQPGQGGCAEGNHNNPGCPPVCNADNLRFPGVCRLHQADHALDGAVLSHLGRLHIEGTELVDSPAGYRVTGMFVHGQGLAGHDRLVDRRFAGDDLPVHRDGFPGEDAEQVAHANLFGGDNFLLAAGKPAGGLGG